MMMMVTVGLTRPLQAGVHEMHQDHFAGKDVPAMLVGKRSILQRVECSCAPSNNNNSVSSGERDMKAWYINRDINHGKGSVEQDGAEV